MGTFVRNGASQVYGGATKTNSGTPTGATTEWKAADANDVANALLDLRASITGQVFNVKDYGATGDGTTDDTSAINTAAAAAGSAILYFPPGNYKITGTITGGTATYNYGTWIGAGTPGQDGRSYSGQYSTTITCSGANGGNYFVIPPAHMEGIYFDGVDRSGNGIQVATEYFFRSGLLWKDIVVRNFIYGVRAYNVFDAIFERLVCTDCTYGFYTAPLHSAGSGSPAGNNGYWTNTTFTNCWFANCYTSNFTFTMPSDGYALTLGILMNSCVVQNPQSGATSNINLANCSMVWNGMYTEGGDSFSVPALKVNNVDLCINGWNCGFTYGFDFQSQDSKIVVTDLVALVSTDIFRNVTTGSYLDAKRCYFNDDPRSVFSHLKMWGCTVSNGGFSNIAPPSNYDGILKNTSTWNPGNLSASTSASTTITVTGAAVGDAVFVAHSNLASGLMMYGWVSATNTVTATIFNATGSPNNPGSGTLTAYVFKR